MSKLEDQFDSYYSLTERKFEIIEGRLDGLSSDVRAIKENHLDHLSNDVASMKTDIGWLKTEQGKQNGQLDSLNTKFWAVIIGIAGTLALVLLQLFIDKL